MGTVLRIKKRLFFLGRDSGESEEEVAKAIHPSDQAAGDGLVTPDQRDNPPFQSATNGPGDVERGDSGGLAVVSRNQEMIERGDAIGPEVNPVLEVGNLLRLDRFDPMFVRRHRDDLRSDLEKLPLDFGDFPFHLRRKSEGAGESEMGIQFVKDADRDDPFLIFPDPGT